MRHAEFEDARLVAIYDAEYPWSRDDDFFLALVNEMPAARVLDLGCGSGRLALGVAASGHTVTGVDPARASLTAARAKPGAELITWMVGTSAVLPARSFDIGMMTSHVAQVFVDDGEWSRTLIDLERALVPGGRLVFDTRDPRARAWEQWNPSDSHRRVRLPDERVVEVWTEVTEARGGVVSFAIHYRFPEGDRLLSTATLRFRTEDELRCSLVAAGFSVEQIYGGWNREPPGAGDGEFLVLARSRTPTGRPTRAKSGHDK